jgi:hypothetical protein
MEVSDQLDDPAILPPIPIVIRSWLGPSSGLGRCGVEKDLSLQESDHGRPTGNTSLNRLSCRREPR